MYNIPRLLDVNAKSKLFRDKEKLLIIGRCIEIEHPEILDDFIKKGYGVLSVCLEAEHANQVGLKLAGILARGKYSEVAVLTVDGSMHCTQLHWVVEEVFKIMNLDDKVLRKHYVVYKGKLYTISLNAVKISRYLSRVEKLLEIRIRETK